MNMYSHSRNITLYVFRKTIQFDIPLHDLRIGRLIEFIPHGQELTLIVENDTQPPPRARPSQIQNLAVQIRDQRRTYLEGCGSQQLQDNGSPGRQAGVLEPLLR